MCITGSDIPLRLNNPEVIENPARLRHCRKSPVLRRIMFPIRSQLPKLFLCLLCYVKNIPVSFLKPVQFLHHPVHRIFRKYRSRPVGRRLVSCKQGLRLNVNCHMFQNIPEHIGPFENHRLIRVHSVAFRRKYCTLRADIRLRIQKFFPEIMHTFRQLSKVIVFHGCFLLKTLKCKALRFFFS